MNKAIQKLAIGAALVAVGIGTVAVSTGLQAARPDGSSRRVIIDCGRGWRGGAGGTYGGVPFDVGCFNGKGQAMLSGTVGTGYTIRMGVESSSTGGDCAYDGDSETVSEACLGVGLSIR